MKLRARKAEAITAIPVANPSMLSRRFTAFVIPINQKMVNAILSDEERVHGRLRP